MNIMFSISIALIFMVLSVSAQQQVDVFVMGEGPYYCIKIPYLFRTARGTLIALAEARYNSCSDYTGTDLVMKRSLDNGTTWSSLEVLYSNTSVSQNISNVVGNAAPLQLRSSGRIIIPFCVNNLLAYQMHSDDDGVSWHGPFYILGAVAPGWQWLGLGPPGGLQL
eukprot:PhF_6_TR8606/c0_g1_i1/m.13420/K01186/NEU1; sialidase-1